MIQNNLGTVAVVGAIAAIALNTTDNNTKALAVGALAGATTPLGGALVAPRPRRRRRPRTEAIRGDSVARFGAEFSEGEE